MMLDTSFLVDLARGDPGAVAYAREAEAGSEAMRIPAPALAKLWEAVERSRRPPREREALRALLLACASAPFEAPHALLAARYLAASAAEGWGLDAFDAMVAAVAVHEEEALVTRNLRDFERVPDLRLRAY